ncbi:MAG: putative peptidoglycan glycosyltransferase FtsW [Burkholderia sp.]|jgi:cell division protein FtsW
MMLNRAKEEWQKTEGFIESRTERGTGVFWEVLLCVLALLAIGCVMVYSATSMFADNSRYGVDAGFFLRKHLQSIAVGAAVGWLVFQVPMTFWQRWAPWIFAGALALLFLVFVPGLGKSVNGARRWIGLGIMNLQVSEVMKVAALIMAAWYTVRRQDYMHSIQKGFLPMALIMVLVVFPIMQQPDLGAVVVIVVEMMGLLFLGGLSMNIFVTVSIFVVGFVCWMIYDTPWRLGRFLAFLDPWSPDHVLGKAYQLSHSLIAFGRGELTGVGLGGSVEKLYYLPEAHTDFIMAVIAEETGFIGIVGLLFLYYWLIRHAFEIGRQAIKLERYFSGLIAEGVGIWIGVQVIINGGVAMGLLPTKGLTLPLVSFGGSALLSTLAGIGLLLRVDKENRILMRGGQV